MHASLQSLLDMQELDIKMIRLMRMKKQRQKELKQIETLRADLQEQVQLKEEEIQDFDKQIELCENQISELVEELKKLEAQQINIKKVDEFNAMTQKMTGVEREKAALEQKTSNILDKKASEEEILEKIKKSLADSEADSKELESEIMTSIKQINEEGQSLKAKRDELAKSADPEVLPIYMRLLQNKKDRVIVPIENHTCSGCHIALTIQHENMVRKGTSLVFCEHCSRLHFWKEEEEVHAEGAPSRRRRRRVVKT